MLSAPASVVMVTFVPATSVIVSVVLSATTLLWPETANVSKRFWLPPPAVSVDHERFPALSVLSTFPEEDPSLVGKV